MLRRGRTLRVHVDDRYAERWDRLLGALEHRLAPPSPSLQPPERAASVNRHSAVYWRFERQLFSVVSLGLIGAGIGGLFSYGAWERVHNQEWGAAALLLIGSSPFIALVVMMPVAVVAMIRLPGRARKISTTGNQTPAVMTLTVKPYDQANQGADPLSLILKLVVGGYDEVTASVTGATLPRDGLVFDLAPAQHLPRQRDNVPVTLLGTPTTGELIVVRFGDLTLWPAAPAHAGQHPSDLAKRRSWKTLSRLRDQATDLTNRAASRICDRLFGPEGDE